MFNIEDKVLNNFLYLISYDTKSNPKSKRYPSTNSQIEFGEMLVKKCKEIGLTDIKIDKNGYVIATLKSNSTEFNSKIGFIAHMDTSPDFDGKVVNPNIIKNYNGEDIKLKNNVVISPNEFSSLNNYIGKTLITSDGTTLLGADDKAGIAEILTAFEYLANRPEIPHGEIKLAFTPDEEIGKGVEYFDVKEFNCDYAYTIDGGKVGELSFENFNASEINIEISGKNVHPGHATNVMINSALIANELIAKIQNENPATTSGYEGFYHLTEISGNVEKTSLQIIIRAFNKEEFEQKNKNIEDIIKHLQNKYNTKIEYDLSGSYYNMFEILKDKMEIIEKAKKAIKKTGIEPEISPIRGGTDGSKLSFMGLPCPNIFTGGHNFHGPYEYICLQSMVKAVETIINIATEI